MTTRRSNRANVSDNAIETRPSLDRSALVILCLALAIGAWLRFEHLARFDMTAGEAVSWVAAAAPNVREVVARAIPRNPGKLGLHDVTLHFWMRFFGDSVASQRALSALLGVLAIPLTFMVAREMLALTTDDLAGKHRSDWIAAVAALLAAINLPLIHHSREARMYPLVIAALLAQVWFFLRAYRIGGWYNYLAVTVLSVLAIADHFTAGSVMLAEGLWIAPGLLRTDFPRPGELQRRRILKLFGALAASGILLAPVLRVPMFFARGFFGSGYAWVHRPLALAPIEFFIAGFGDGTSGQLSFHHHVRPAFLVMTPLAVWGAIAGWRSSRSVVTFALLWILVPILLPQILSYLIKPFFLLEYALSSFVPFLILAALGLSALRPRLRYGALTLAFIVLLFPIRAYSRRHSEHWGEAVALAAANLRANEIGMVAPGWTIDVVDYYMRNDHHTRIEAAPNRVSELRAPFPNVVIITDYGADHDPIAMKVLSLKPELLGKFVDLSVYRLPPQALTALSSESGVENVQGAARTAP